MVDVCCKPFVVAEAMYADKPTWSLWCAAEKQRLLSIVADRGGVVIGEPLIFLSPRVKEDKMRDGISLVVAEIPV